jgi:hypothetical protein
LKSPIDGILSLDEIPSNFKFGNCFTISAEIALKPIYALLNSNEAYLPLSAPKPFELLASDLNPIACIFLDR